MAGGPYDAGFTAPDIGPGAALIASVLNSNRANERADEFARMQREAMDRSAERESAEEKRKDEETKRRHQIEAFTQLPLLQRAALRSMKETGSPGYAAANPYGINFAVEQGEAPSLRKAGINVMGGGYGEQAAADLATHGQIGTEGEPNQLPAQVSPAQALLGQSPMLGPTEEATLRPGQEGPEISPALEAARFDEPEAAHGPTEEAVEAPSGIAAAQALLNQPRSKKLYATYEGQRFEVPEESDSTGLGPKYDAIYRTMLANMPPGATQQHAFDKVLADYEKDQAETARGARLEKTLGFRGTNREDQQTFQRQENEKYKSEGLTFEQRKELANIAARARAAAAGAGPTAPIVPELIHMAEEGAPLSEIATTAGKTPQKQYMPAIQNVVKNAAAGERAGQKREALTATGEGTNPGDMWKSPQAATKGTQQIQRFHRVRERMQALIDHIKKYGERIDPDAQQYQDRMSLAEAAAAALRPYNELSSTDASMAAERAILGPAGAFGHGWTIGANLKGLERILSEAEGQQKVNLSTMLRPGGGSKLAPSLGGPRQQAGGGQVGAAKKWLSDNPTADPDLRAKVEARIKQLEGGGG